jgi:hypothetical protein
MRKWIAGLVASFMLIFGGIACDDNPAPEETQKIDEDDSQPGPGDGSDETGPGR